MPRAYNLQLSSLAQAVETFKELFREQFPDSQFLIDGEGYEDEDLDLNIYLDGDQFEVEQYAVEVSHRVQQLTGYFILPFVLPTSEYPKEPKK